MSITVILTKTSVGNPLADGVINGVCAVTNNESGSVTVRDIRISEVSTMGSVIRQPDFLVPNAAPGTYPTLTTTATGNYPWSIVVPSPCTPGPSPNSPSGVQNVAYPASNAVLRLQCVVMVNDGSVNIMGTALLQFPIGSAVAPFPVPQGGALQFNTGGDAVNFFFFG